MSSAPRGKAQKAYKVVKPKKNTRHTTKTTRNYRFQTFNDRIANLKIDPIRRKRHVDTKEEAAEDSHTHFGQSLESWRDTNLSQTFTGFAKEASPLCDNIAMVLYNHDRIMDLLVRYIEKGDALAMEPLLNLLSHLARDLDSRFEAHFQRAVATVTAIAAKHADFTVIEWSFTCLAWLFKYLSRLLTPDLRPLYDLMAPYLGREQQRPFIVRFTAEALSFLVRKTAAVYDRDQKPLDTIMEHMVKDVQGASMGSAAEMHAQGIMTLLTEAVKGVQNGINSSAVPVLQSLLKHAGRQAEINGLVMDDLVSGILTSLIHHCNADTFKPVMDLILEHAQHASHSASGALIRFCSNLLFTTVSVRKGTRITEWKKVMESVKDLVLACRDLAIFEEGTATTVLGLLAIAMQTATIDAVLLARQVPDALRSGTWEPYFLRFCDMFIRLGTERFHQFMLPQFDRYVFNQTGADDMLFQLIPYVTESKPGLRLKCHPSMINTILDDLEKASQSGSAAGGDDELLSRTNLRITAIASISLSEKQHSRYQELVERMVTAALGEDSRPRETFYDLALSVGLEHLLNEGRESAFLISIWSGLCSAAPNFVRLPKFCSNLAKYMQVLKPTDITGPHIESLENALICGLAMPSHTIRENCLDSLSMLYKMRDSDTPAALSTAITIESMPVSLETSRSMSMNIRRLVPEYQKAEGDGLTIRAIPTYCFGLLHVHLAQAWEEAVKVLAAVAQEKAGEDVIMELVQSWLDGEAAVEIDGLQTGPLLDVNSDGFKVFSDFECPNLAKIAAIREQVFAGSGGGRPSPQQKLAADQRRTPSITPTARGQALKVLSKIPHIAEKRSRLLVPVLLKWTGVDAEESIAPETQSQRWARKDQKSMLAIFAQFVNPKVLFKSNEVYNALLSLCANGDIEIQRSALKAILAWKEPSITRYEEHLNNLLDEARFREELSVFLTDELDEQEDAIRPTDHAQLMPLLLRLLYGRAVAGGKEGQGGRRKAIFVALSRFGEDTLKQFVNIALGAIVDTTNPNLLTTSELLQSPRASLRQQVGMLNMVNDMLQVLGNELESFVPQLMTAVLSCTVSASRQIDSEGAELDSSLLRSVRQAGLQCIVKIFNHMDVATTKLYGYPVAENLVEPRLATFVRENTQSVSSTLRLFAAWSVENDLAKFFTGHHEQIMGCVAGLLRDAHAKDEVRLFILQHIVLNLLGESIDGIVLEPHLSDLVQAIGAVIEDQPSKDVLDACVNCFSQLAERIASDDEAAGVVRLCTDLLTKPVKTVSAGTKAGLLRTLLPLVERFEVPSEAKLFDALCGLFSRLQHSESRSLLAHVLRSVVQANPELVKVAITCEDMNAMTSRLDEPDHDRRERAFAWIYESSKMLSLQQWQPIIHNCLYYIRDGEDRVNRSSAAHALQLFVDAAAASWVDEGWKSLLDEAVFAGIERGMRESSELVRAEYLNLLGHIVDKLPDWAKVAGMNSLVVGGDEEASFFANVLHIQQHRRLRALRRLSEEASSVGPTNASRIFLPLLEHFVFDQVEGDSGRTLADQAVQSIGAVAKALNRQAFRATFQRYTGYLKTKTDLEKMVLRLLSALVDGLYGAPHAQPNSEAIVEDHLPPLLEYLHQKDESTVDRRMPVAVTIVKLMQLLPEAEFVSRLPGVLTDVCHVLRSRSLEARDETRKALKVVSSLVGSQYFGFILRELRGALRRGYQLHVLSFTVHHLLVESKFEPGDLDECLPDLMLVIMDDIFGVTGQEKEAEEYKTAMKEIKSSKSYDTMELLARVTPIHKLGDLIRPIRSLLSEKVDMSIVKKIDMLLARLRSGLDQNSASDSRDMLSFCWEIVNQVYAEESTSSSDAVKVDERRKRYLVMPEARKSSKAKGATTSYNFKLISFAFNLLRKVVRRHEDLQTPQNMAGFLPMAGDALVQGQQEVKLSALRLLSSIMRVPLPQLDLNAPVYVKEAVLVINGAIAVNSDDAKAALELITAVLREKRTVSVKEKDIATILKRIKNDIDEPDSQSMVYKFLRAVLGRKFVITEVYEVMDEVGRAMVTNPDQQIRESARGAYLQFVMEYPQGKDRWKKQTAFLVSNLKYEHAAGRRSVMEFLHQMLGKIGDEIFAETGPRIFVALLPVIVNDADTSCRDMARLLVGRIFERAGGEQLAQFLSLLNTWLQPGKKSSVKSGALQCWAVLLQKSALPVEKLEGLRDQLEEVLSDCSDEESFEAQLVLDALQAFAGLIETSPAVGLARASANLWQAIQQLPSADHPQVQESVATILGSFYTDVASTSSKTADGLAGLPLQGSGGLEVGAEDMRRLCAVNLRALRAISLNTSESLTAQIIRNTVFLGRCFAANDMPWNENAPAEASSSSNEEEAEEDPEDSDEEATDADDAQTKSALAYLARRLSSLLAADKFSVKARTASLQCLTALLQHIPIIPNIQVVLRPLYALTDPSVPQPPGDLFQALRDKASEALEVIQKKMGPEAYVAALAKTRAEAKERRDERRKKRRIEAVSRPEKWARDKKRKYEGKREKKKVKGLEARGRRRGW